MADKAETRHIDIVTEHVGGVERSCDAADVVLHFGKPCSQQISVTGVASCGEDSSMLVEPFVWLGHSLFEDVEIWLVDLDGYAQRTALAPPAAEDRERAARLVFEADRRRFLAGRHALRSVLSNVLKVPAAELRLETGLLGKPKVAGGESVHFNFSHSGHVALIGVTRGGPIGVDIELLRSVPDVEALAASQLTLSERSECGQIAGGVDSATFLRCWTRKEASLKALGIGLYVPPNNIDVGCGTDRRRVQLSVGSEQVTVHPRSIVDLPLNAIAAVALATLADVALAEAFFHSS